MAKPLYPIIKEYSKDEDVDVINYRASYKHISEDNIQMCEKVKDILPLINYKEFKSESNLKGINNFFYDRRCEVLMRLVIRN